MTILSIPEHERAAALLVFMDAAIGELIKLTGDRKGLSVRLIDRLIRADNQLHIVRSGLETLMFDQHRGDGRLSTDVYYPRTDRDRTREAGHAS